jgi:hypothetical protein
MRFLSCGKTYIVPPSTVAAGLVLQPGRTPRVDGNSAEWLILRL